jgi:hypothetical protein
VIHTHKASGVALFTIAEFCVWLLLRGGGTVGLLVGVGQGAQGAIGLQDELVYKG